MIGPSEVANSQSPVLCHHTIAYLKEFGLRVQMVGARFANTMAKRL